jgi:hypothetical protein
MSMLVTFIVWTTPSHALQFVCVFQLNCLFLVVPPGCIGLGFSHQDSVSTGAYNLFEPSVNHGVIIGTGVVLPDYCQPVGSWNGL